MIRRILNFDWAFWFFWLLATTLGWFLGGLFGGGLSDLVSGAAVAALQSFVLQGRLRRAYRWAVAGALGWAVGWFAWFLLVPGELLPLYGLLLGLGAGLAQWGILRREVHFAGWWPLFSALGWLTGIAVLPGVTLTGTVAGMLTGLALLILLQNRILPGPQPNR